MLISSVLIVFVVMLSQSMMELNETTSDLSEIQYLNSSTQRCVRMVLNGNVDGQLIFQINNHTESELVISNEDHISVLENEDNAIVAQDAVEVWETLVTLMYEEEINANLIQLTADNHFNSMSILSNQIIDEIDILNTEVKRQQLGIVLLITLIAIIVATHLIKTTIELKQNRELATLAAIDVATGLYNRSKCQDLFKTQLKKPGINCDAIIVVDLNDLKKTNDTMGHQVGDDLIQCFATLLKEACDVHSIKPFVGRYGGDEFIIYYQSIDDESEIIKFINQLMLLTTNFNKSMKRFNVSYALGYALNNDVNHELAIKELFDKADEKMYHNKKVMKGIQ